MTTIRESVLQIVHQLTVMPIGGDIKAKCYLRECKR